MAWKRPGVRIPLAPLECGEVLLGLDQHSGGTLTTDAVLFFVSLSLSKEKVCSKHLLVSLFWIGV